MKFHSSTVSEHPEVPHADGGQLERTIERFSAAEPRLKEVSQSNRVYVVSVCIEKEPQVAAAKLREISSLVRSQGDELVGAETCTLSVPNSRTVLGSGRAQSLAERARALGANMLVLDLALTPSHQRNLEDVVLMAVCDREAVILNVFLRNARTPRAKMQVQLAQLQYLRPRIRGIGINMDQQAGGNAQARGPGETASELMARTLDARMHTLENGLRKLATRSLVQRDLRLSSKRAVLVGYTNAGKTSLMNALAKSALPVRDAPFETLDTTTRCLTRHGGDVLLSDSVGFIRQLPERLMASFASTLDEVAQASLVVIVVDASDCELASHLDTTHSMLARLGAADTPRFYVFNKSDCAALSPAHATLLAQRHPWRAVSTHDPRAMEALREELVAACRASERELELTVPYEATHLLQLVYRSCRVIHTEALPAGLHLRCSGTDAALSKIETLASAGGSE
jgi:GTPase